MNDADLLNDLRYLRDVVARTQPPTVNHDWPLAVSWGCIIMIGYAICALLGYPAGSTSSRGSCLC
jgi:hypothetical protein